VLISSDRDRSLRMSLKSHPLGVSFDFYEWNGYSGQVQDSEVAFGQILLRKLGEVTGSNA
jgi:hypothetical protein